MSESAVSQFERGRIAAIASAVALVFSGYSLWTTALRQTDISIYVPPVIYYASPYQNTNFEVFAVPLTMTNSGARTGTILSLTLEVENLKTREKKRFFSGDFGTWTVEKANARGFEPFAPIALEGRGSRTESLLFYTRGPEEKVQQIVPPEPGRFRFTLNVDTAPSREFGFLDRIWSSKPPSVTFERVLHAYNAGAFQTGTLPLFSPTWQTDSSPSGV